MLRYIPHVFRRSFRRRIACRDIHFGRSGRKETENVRIAEYKAFLRIVPGRCARIVRELQIVSFPGYKPNLLSARLAGHQIPKKSKKYPGGSWFRTSGIYDANVIDPDLRTLRSGVFP